MKKSEFLKAVKESLELKNMEQAEQTITAIVDVINNALIDKGDKLKIDGLGTFKVKKVKGKPERKNPLYGKSPIPQKPTLPATEDKLVLKFEE